MAGMAFVIASFGRTERSDGQSRAWLRLVPGFVLVTMLAIVIGCGSKSSSSTTNPQFNYVFAVQVPSTAPVASGAVTVNAAIGGINHTAQITVTTQ